jgi:translation initiation factor 2 subunit 3
MEKQPILNLIMIGHVADGKSTLTKVVTGVKTQKHSKEKERNITMRLGYANAKIIKCLSCSEPENYQSVSSLTTVYKCSICNSDAELVNHVSFVDSPGHNSLMAVMLTGTSVADYSILVESVDNKEIPAPQTREHLISTQYANVPNAFVCLNKIDLRKIDDTRKSITELTAFLDTTTAKGTLIIPISASMGINIDIVCELLAKLVPPERHLKMPFEMMIIRSFNANMPSTLIEDLKGGVIGGSILRGTIKTGSIVLIYPGYVIKKSEIADGSKWYYKPIEAVVESILSEKTSIDEAISGGLIGIQLNIDPALTAEDKLAGQTMVDPKHENIGKVYEGIDIEYEEIDDLEHTHVLNVNNKVIVNINSASISGTIQKINIKNDKFRIKIVLDKPLYAHIGDFVTISYIEGGLMEIMGKGKIKRADECKIIY